MFFIEWYEVAYALAVVLLPAGSIWFWKRVHAKGILLKILAGLAFVPAFLLPVILSLVLLSSLGCDTVSQPVYSPDHSKAFRLSNLDGGALGGSTAVEVFSHHGFWQSYVFRGYWHDVEPKDVYWIDDSHLAIKYSYFAGNDECRSTAGVRVDCSRKPPPSNSGSLPSPAGSQIAELHKAKDGSYEGTDAVVLTESSGYTYVYVGAPNSVIWSDTHWKSDHELEIATKGEIKACSSQIGITVTCTHVEEK